MALVGVGTRAYRFEPLPAGSSTLTPNDLPVALLITHSGSRPAVIDAIERIRARSDVLAYAPVFLVDASTHPTDRGGADLLLSAPPDTALLDAWTIAPNPVVPRLLDLFGHGAIISLLSRFRDALIALDGAFGDGDAHKIAGLAGTLGYSELGTACAALEQDPTTPDIALREVRKAIYDVAQHLAALDVTPG